MGTLAAPLPSMGYLGWSYDAVTGNYADVDSLLSSVLKDGAVSELVVDPPLPDSGFKFLTIAGKTFDEYSQSLATNVNLEGTYGGFSGSLSASFGMTRGGSVTTAFCTTWGRTVVQRFDLKLDSTGLQKFLNTGFTHDLTEVGKKTMHPFAFFRKWGTHYIHGVVVGGRFVAGFTTQTTSSFNTDDFQATVNAKYSSPAGLSSMSAGASVELKSSRSSATYQCSTHVSTYGGAKTLDYSTWLPSVEANPSIMDFPKGGLQPIYSLCADPEIRAILKAALVDYCRPPLQLRVFSATGIAANHSTVDLFVPDGYKILGGGASTGTDGIYLTSSYPVSATQWHAEAKDHIYPFSNPLTAYAIAVYDPKDALDVQIIQGATSPLVPHPVGTAKVPDGHLMTGGGALVRWTGAGNLLFGSCPDAADATRSTWVAKSKDHSYPSPATITAYAIGVKANPQSTYPYPGFELAVLKQNIATLTSSLPSQGPTAEVAVPSGLQLVGGGALDNWTVDGNLLNGSYPYPDSSSTWYAKGHDCNVISLSTITAYAIGLGGLPPVPSEMGKDRQAN